MLKDDNGIVLKDTISVEMCATFFQSVFSIDDGILPNLGKKIKSYLRDLKFGVNDINTHLRTLPR